MDFINWFDCIEKIRIKIIIAAIFGTIIIAVIVATVVAVVLITTNSGDEIQRNDSTNMTTRKAALYYDSVRYNDLGVVSPADSLKRTVSPSSVRFHFGKFNKEDNEK